MPKANWPFDDPPNVATITVRQIIKEGAPILLVARDAEDGGWQFLTGGAFEVADSMVVSLREVFKHDPTIAELADLEPGWEATRKKVGAPWRRRSGLTKVLFRLDEDVETMWAKRLGRHRYRLDNCPFFAYGVSCGDVVEARPPTKGEIPEFVRIVKKSGNRTIRIIFKPAIDKSRKSMAVVEKLVAMGCSYEGANPGYIVVNIPAKLDLAGICQYVTSTKHRWEHADPTYDELYSG
jgi:Domain of unknown function (DUF4265)